MKMKSLFRFLDASWTLAAKDLLAYSRDRMALLTGFLVPIVLVTIFGTIMTYAFGGSSGMAKIKLWVVDEDQTDASKKWIASLNESEMLSILPKEGSLTADQLIVKVQDGDAHHGLVIPKGYTATQLNEKAPSLRMIRDPGRSMEDRIIRIAIMQNMVTQGDGNFMKQSIHRIFQKEGMSPSQLVELDKTFAATSDTIRQFLEQQSETASPSNNVETPKEKSESTNESKSESKEDLNPSSEKTKGNASSSVSRDPFDFLSSIVPVENEDLTPPSRPKMVSYQQAQSVSGMSVMMLLFGLTGAGALLLAEREHGTLRRLMALPIERETILLGKFIYVFIIGLIQMSILFIYGELLFRVGLFRDPLTTLVLVLSWAAAATSFSMAVATFATSSKQGDGLATIVILAMAALGGCWFPVQMMDLPLPLEIVSKSTMTYWAMEGFQGMLWSGLRCFDWKIVKSISIVSTWTVSLSLASVYFFRRNYIS